MGRPRCFDESAVLDAAMHVFWLKGYEGASVSDLTEAMGINSPSLYAAFGSKEGLFRAVLKHYDASREGVMDRILSEPSAREVALRYLCAVADFATDKRHPPGCLLVKAGLSPTEGEVAKQLARHKTANELALRDRFERAKHEGDLPSDADAKALARYVIAIGSGLCVQAVTGIGREELRQIALMAVSGVPAIAPTRTLATAGPS